MPSSSELLHIDAAALTQQTALQVVGALAAVAGIGLIAGGGYVYRDTIKQGLTWFISVVRPSPCAAAQISARLAVD